mgnify:FL=1
MKIISFYGQYFSRRSFYKVSNGRQCEASMFFLAFQLGLFAIVEIAFKAFKKIIRLSIRALQFCLEGFHFDVLSIINTRILLISQNPLFNRILNQISETLARWDL